MRHVDTDRDDVQELWEAADEETRQQGNVPISRGRMVPAVLTTGSNLVAHGLQRQPDGWIVADRDSAATIYRTDWDDKNLTLQAGANCNVQLWVF